MKKLLAAVLGLFGVAGAASAEPTVRMIDPKEIQASIPTISEDAAPLEPASNVSPGQLVFHEDDWRQIEFFPKDRLAEIQRVMGELSVFEKAHRSGSGWSELYLRKVATARLADDPRTIADDLASSVQAPPVLFYGLDHVVGQVVDGFSIPLGERAWLYGIGDGSGVILLGASLQDADDQLLTNAAMTLMRTRSLILVDWRSQVILVGVADDGRVEAWSPADQ